METKQITEPVERGAAEIRIKLKHGTITIYHSDGSTLHQVKNVEHGSWDKLWETIYAIKKATE